MLWAGLRENQKQEVRGPQQLGYLRKVSRTETYCKYFYALIYGENFSVYRS